MYELNKRESSEKNSNILEKILLYFFLTLWKFCANSTLKFFYYSTTKIPWKRLVNSNITQQNHDWIWNLEIYFQATKLVKYE